MEGSSYILQETASVLDIRISKWYRWVEDKKETQGIRINFSQAERVYILETIKSRRLQRAERGQNPLLRK